MANLKDIGYGVGKYLTASDASDIPDIGTNRKNLDLLNFKVAVNNAYSLYNFKDGMIDGYQTEGGVDTSSSTNYIYDSTNKVFKVSGPPTGGTITTDGGDTIHTFLSSSDFVVYGGGNVDALVVAGGGGGGENNFAGGGGGAGGFRYITSQAITAATHAVTVGAGGAAYNSGNNSSFGALISATAGGRGGGTSGPADKTGDPGGSGGGGMGWDYGTQAGGAGNAGSYSPVEGYAGGSNTLAAGTGAGGGGSSGVGANGVDDGSNNVAGGAGTSNSITGSAVTYAAGGRGAKNGWNGVDGTANTGNGGDGSKVGGATGGSGIVVIRYTTGALGAANMTLKSNAQTAQAAPDEGRLILYEEDVDSITLDTDLKGYVSRDDGTTYTQTPLVEDTPIFNIGGIDSNTKLMLHCDGANDGTTFTDSSDSAHTITVGGNTHTDTAIKKFGTASAQFDGTTDSLTVASSADFNPFGVDFTVDFWVYINGWGAQYDMLIGNTQVNTAGWNIQLETSGGKINFLVGSGSGWDINTVSTGTGYALSLSTWYHIAVVKNGSAWTMYVDGTSRATGTSTPPNYTAALDIGASTLWADRDLNGYMDEIRISKGVARWTDTFSVPTREYTSGAYEPPQRILSGSVDISGQPAGSNMKYKVETLNDKNLKLHGASLLWA